MKNLFTKLAILGILVVGLALPAVSSAQTRSQLQRRQQQKNQWRNIAYGTAALGALGLVKKNSTLTLLGVAGTAYAAHRYEQDRKSQRRMTDAARWRSSVNRRNALNRARAQRLRQSQWRDSGPGRRGIGNAWGHYKNGKWHKHRRGERC